MSVIGWILFLIVAAICAGIAAYIVPGSIPGGFLTAMIVGFAGAWLGVYLIGPWGPILAGVAIFPAILGSGLLVFAIAALSGSLGRNN